MEWPHKIYNIQSIIAAVRQRVDELPTDIQLMDALAVLYTSRVCLSAVCFSIDCCLVADTPTINSLTRRSTFTCASRDPTLSTSSVFKKHTERLKAAWLGVSVSVNLSLSLYQTSTTCSMPSKIRCFSSSNAIRSELSNSLSTMLTKSRYRALNQSLALVFYSCFCPLPLLGWMHPHNTGQNSGTSAERHPANTA